MTDSQRLRDQASGVVTALSRRGFRAVQRPLFSLRSEAVLRSRMAAEGILAEPAEPCGLTLHGPSGTVITVVPQDGPGFTFTVAHEYAHAVMMQRGCCPSPLLAEGFAQLAGYIYLVHDDGSPAAKLMAEEELGRQDVYGDGLRLCLAALKRVGLQRVWYAVALNDEAALRG